MLQVKNIQTDLKSFVLHINPVINGLHTVDLALKTTFLLPFVEKFKKTLNTKLL